MGMITESEMAVDVVQMLAETENAIVVLGQHGVDVPAEAIQMRSMMRRCVAAESAKADLLAVCQELEASASYWSEYDVPLGIVDRLKAAIARATGATP